MTNFGPSGSQFVGILLKQPCYFESLIIDVIWMYNTDNR
jgi:hypothetical protein